MPVVIYYVAQSDWPRMSTWVRENNVEISDFNYSSLMQQFSFKIVKNEAWFRLKWM